MTTILGKGAGRPAAAARTAKHAQRDVQTGPRPAVAVAQAINDAAQSAPDSEAAMAAALDGTAYGRMSVDELKARAKALLIKPLPRTKGALLTAILGAERVAQPEPQNRETHLVLATDEDTEHLDTWTGDDEEPAEVAATEPAGNLDPKGAAKASKLTAAIVGHGWTSDSPHGDGDKVTFVARRGGETLTVAWLGGVYQYDESAHLVHDRTTRLRNVSAAIKLAGRSAAEVEAEYGKVISNRRFRPAQTKAAEGHLQGVPADKRLFPAPSGVTQDELWAALAGYRVVWVNRVSNMTESATVSQNARFFNVRHNPKGELMVEFCTVGMGFRACRVADIISTSRKAGKARRTKTLSGGEEVRAA
jgi:hypothetical protein